MVFETVLLSNELKAIRKESLGQGMILAPPIQRKCELRVAVERGEAQDRAGKFKGGYVEMERNQHTSSGCNQVFDRH